MQQSFEGLTAAIQSMIAAAPTKTKPPPEPRAKKPLPKLKAPADEGEPLHSKASTFRRHPKNTSSFRRLISEYIRILYIHIIYICIHIYIYIYKFYIYIYIHIQGGTSKKPAATRRKKD